MPLYLQSPIDPGLLFRLHLLLHNTSFRKTATFQKIQNTAGPSKKVQYHYPTILRSLPLHSPDCLLQADIRQFQSAHLGHYHLRCYQCSAFRLQHIGAHCNGLKSLHCFSITSLCVSQPYQIAITTKPRNLLFLLQSVTHFSKKQSLFAIHSLLIATLLAISTAKDCLN